MKMGEMELLDFYKKQLNELQASDDKYKEKVDKYLRELIADRHELVSENLRRGEKISDLQTALVDLQLSCFEERERFLKVTAENEKLKLNELKLHENIRHLLNVTKEKDLRDRIIYILDDPKVEIGYRYENSKSSGTTFKHKRSSDDFLKEQVHQLQSKLEEHRKISQSKTDVLLEDCKVTLEKSKEKLLQNEEEIRVLQKRLQDAEELLKIENKPSASHKTSEKNTTLSDSKSDSYKFKSKSSYELKADFTALENISSCAAEMRLPLVFLSKIIKKAMSLLNKIQTSQIFIQASKLPKQSAGTHKYVVETDIIQLQSYIRQCTRLSYEAHNVLKSLKKILLSGEIVVTELNIHSELQDLESVFEELSASTAVADLKFVSLSRATFFDYLTAPKQMFNKFGVKDISNCSKYVDDVNKIASIYKNDSDLVLKAIKLTERIQENISKLKSETQLLSSTQVDQDSLTDQSNSAQDQERNCLNSLPKSRSDSVLKEKSSVTEQDKLSKHSIEKRISRNAAEIGVLIKRIDKTLAKISNIKSGEYIRDTEFCQYLGEQVKALTEKLNQLYNEFNVQDIQEQFSEYTSVTLSKLETIAQQSRDAVISAEAQISAHRSHAKNLSHKLKDTEDLLRESISECLSLKQKLQREKVRRAVELTQFRNGLQEKLQSVADFDELESAVKEVISSTHSARKMDMNTQTSKDMTKQDKATSYHARVQEKRSILVDSDDEEETAVNRVYSVKSLADPKKPSGPFECMYCKQGSEHKLCDEKIRELRANNRKLKTELKLLQQEMKEEKKVAKLSQDQVDKAARESANQNESLIRRLESLESRNTSLLEQLNLEKNRLKKMEQFRRFEIAGSQTDIKNLKIKIQDLEKQLTKAVMIFEHDKKDLELLKSVHTTAQNSKQAAEAVKRLKRKLYELETDLKHL